MLHVIQVDGLRCNKPADQLNALLQLEHIFFLGGKDKLAPPLFWCDVFFGTSEVAVHMKDRCCVAAGGIIVL